MSERPLVCVYVCYHACMSLFLPDLHCHPLLLGPVTLPSVKQRHSLCVAQRRQCGNSARQQVGQHDRWPAA